MHEGRIESINVSDGGVPKLPVEAAELTFAGVAGDRQRDLRHHGGPDRAVCIYALEAIVALRREGHPIDVGTAGENLTMSGIPWPEVAPGSSFTIGPARLLVTSFTTPCSNIAASFDAERFTRIAQKLHPGWSRVYARVLTGGIVRRGDVVRWSAAEATR